MLFDIGREPAVGVTGLGYGGGRGVERLVLGSNCVTVGNYL